MFRILFILALLSLSACFEVAKVAHKEGEALPLLSFEQTDPNCNTDDCTIVQVKFPGLPENELSPLVLGRVSGELRDILLQKISSQESVARTPEELAEDVFSLFDEQRKKGNLHAWKIQRAGQILFTNKDVMTLEVIGYEFTGGVHGLAWRKLMSFDLNDGRLLTIKEVVSPDQWKMFSEVAEFEFRRMRDVPVGKSLKEAGFTFPDGQEFAVSENFGIVGDGIVIQYNPYDVAAYAAGPTELLIPAMALRAVLDRKQHTVKHLLDDANGAVSLALTADAKQ